MLVSKCTHRSFCPVQCITAPDCQLVPIATTNKETIITDVAATLAERGARYGVFADQARYAQGMNSIFESSPNFGTMAPDQKEAFRLFANKMGRILNGDADYSDSWHDIAGYATLVDKRLKGEGK